MSWLLDKSLEKPYDDSFEVNNARTFAEVFTKHLAEFDYNYISLKIFFRDLCKFQKDYYSKPHAHIVIENIPLKYRNRMELVLTNIISEIVEPTIPEFEDVSEGVSRCVGMLLSCLIRSNRL